MRRKGLIKFSLQEIIEEGNIFEADLAIYKGNNVKGVLTPRAKNLISPLAGKLDFYISEKFGKENYLNLLIDNYVIYPNIPLSRVYIKDEVRFYCSSEPTFPNNVLLCNQRHYLFKKLGICGWGDLKHVLHSKSHTKREWRKNGLKIDTTIKYKI